MCGIVGIFNYGRDESITEKLIVSLRDTMIHRGPDAEGIYLSLDKRVGLGHRRLSIIDCSNSANQPMSNEDNTIWIVFNGEIYNHSELRLQLEQKGHKFKTDHADTEVIIHSYEQWGKDCIQYFRGMFAFSIWDEKKKEFWLVRDRFGIKPLYYGFFNGVFIFASEIKAILKHPYTKRRVNEESLYNYLSFLATPPPNTLFDNIYKIPAGGMLTVNKDGSDKLEEYWDVFSNVVYEDVRSEDYYIETILGLLKKSVQYRLVSDVPVGIFLSGGLDSSINTALFSELAKDPVKTFSMGFREKEKNSELPYAKKVAQIFNTEHHELLIGGKEAVEFLPELVYYQDEPIADPVCVPFYYLAKFAKDSGMKVCHTGEGGDELFCGYPPWISILNLYRFNSFTPSLAKKSLLKMLDLANKKDTSKYEFLRRAVNKEPIFWSGSEAFLENRKKELLSDKMRKRFKGYSSVEIVSKYHKKFTEKAKDKSPLNWMTYIDLKFRLPELLLMRVDKMSMASSLETRVPFLDHELVEFVMSIPQSVKIRGNKLKYILKKVAELLLPRDIIYREKQGFGAPVTQWLSGSKLGSLTRGKLADFCHETDFFDKGAIQKILTEKNQGWPIWYLLNFVMWHERWFK
ncbi:MAG: asparagine synthase (glutamine-hydrolyzing) [bacterium]